MKIIRRTALALLALIVAIVNGQQEQDVVKDTTRCVNRAPAFFVMENMDMLTTPDISYSGFSDAQCMGVCADNKDINGLPVPCASASFDSTKSLCRIYRTKAVPDGRVQLKDAPGVRYFEKFCLPKSAPSTCGEALFRRVNQKVLVGFARNVSTETSLEQCARRCLKESFKCKSAVYFFADGECITNTAAAAESPATFVDEHVDKVVYFENACNVHAIPVDIGAGTDNMAEKSAGGADSAPLSPDQHMPKNVTSQPRVTTTLSPEFGDKPGYSRWGAWTVCDRPDGRRVRRRQCTLSDGSQCTAPLLQVQWCADVDPSELQQSNTVDRASSTRSISQSSTTIARQPTSVAPTKTSTTQRNNAQTENSAPTTPDPLDHVQGRDDSIASPAVQNRENVGTLGETVARAGVGPAGPARPDKATHGNDTVTPSTPTTGAPVPINQQGWGAWATTCQRFITDQSCQNGQMIGFQTRACEGNPFQCDGTFFRYCTLPC